MRIVNNSDPNLMIRFNIQLGNFTGPWGLVPSREHSQSPTLVLTVFHLSSSTAVPAISTMFSRTCGGAPFFIPVNISTSSLTFSDGNTHLIHSAYLSGGMFASTIARISRICSSVRCCQVAGSIVTSSLFMCVM